MNALLDCLGPIVIEDDVFFGHDVMLLTSGHNTRVTGIARQCQSTAGPITIRTGAWLASRVTVLPGVTIGAHAVVGAGSVVTRDVPPREFWAGVPAQFVECVTIDEAQNPTPLPNSTQPKPTSDEH